MTFVNAQKSRILVGDFALSGYTKQVSSSWTADMLESSVLTDTAKTFVPGQDTSTLAVNGLLDPDTTADAQFDQLVDWTAAEPVAYGPQGFALGSEVWLANSLKTQFTIASQVSDLVTFDLACQTDGITDIPGRALHDLTARTTSSNGSSYDNAASTAGGGVGHLHVTAYSGFTNIVVKVQHSTDNFSASIVDLVTFSTVTGLTSQRSAVAGTVNRYLRALWTVTGTGSCTFAVAFARR